MKLTSFILRGIDMPLWNGVKKRAAKDGHSLRWVLLALLRDYKAGKALGAVDPIAGDQESRPRA